MEQRDELIELAQEFWHNHRSLNMREVMVDFALSLNPWVETSDRLPSEDGFYLVTWFDQSTNAPKVFVGYWTQAEFRVVVHWRNETTTWSADGPLAWMPLPPAPPQEAK